MVTLRGNSTNAPIYNTNQRRFRRGLPIRALRKNVVLWWCLCILVIIYVKLQMFTFTHSPDNYSNLNKAKIDVDVDVDVDVAACLLVMDDNHFLVEWIAYHYHAAGLRKLVVAIDPKSTTSPLEILGRWKGAIDITVWTSDGDYIVAPGEFEAAQKAIARTFRETTPSLIEHRARQRLFYTHCMRFLKQRDSEQRPKSSKEQEFQSPLPSKSKAAWTMLVDVDEFVRVNYRTANAWAPKANNSNTAQHQLQSSAHGGNTNHTVVTTPIRQPGSIATVLKMLALPVGDSSGSITSKNEPINANANQPPWDHLRFSPCIPLPRIRFVSREDENENQESTTGEEIEKNDSFLTQKYRAHARGEDFNRNKISKTIIDLSRVPLEDIVDVDSIHMPIRKHCSERNRYVLPKDSLLVVNHYLGSYEQFTYRENDARNGISTSGSSSGSNNHGGDASNATTTKVNVRNAHHFQKQQKLRYTPETDDEIKPWLRGFVEHPATEGVAKELLRGSGKLAPKSWRSIFRGNNAGTKSSSSDRCALLFFGLTRSYQEMVLPSLIENVLRPNARHACDVYVHFYKQDTEAPGRRNDGGNLKPDDIFLLEDAVHSVSREYYDSVLMKEEYRILPDHSKPEHEPPIVAFAHDTPNEFSERRSEQLRKYHEETTKSTSNNDTVPAYFPWAAKSYTRDSLDNIVRQWHSIQSAFRLMDYTSRVKKISYSRVGMFRSDCVYVTPIDIASLGTKKQGGSSEGSAVARKIPLFDVNNQFFVTPSFALHPVNDRLVYGPYEAVKIWATKRFDLVEESAKSQTNPGYTMHSERFLNATVFPAMEDLGFGRISNGNICFLRSRVGGLAFVNDCSIDGILPTPQTIDIWNKRPSDDTERKRLSLVEAIVGKSCTLNRMSKSRRWTVASCGENK